MKDENIMKKVQQLLEYAQKNIEYYSNCSKEFQSINEYPIITKNIIKQNIDLFVSNELGDNKKNLVDFLVYPPTNVTKADNEYYYDGDIIIEETTGTSGIPFRCAKTKQERSMLALEMWKQRRSIDRKVLPNNLYQFSHISLGMNKPNVYHYEIDNIIKIYKYIVENNIRWIHTTPVIILSHIDCLIKHDIKLEIKSLKYIELCGYFVSYNDRDIIEKYFNVKVINQYGSIETWPFALSDNDIHRLKINENIVYFELVDEENNVINNYNEKGRVVITTLNNRVFPFIRYQNGDYAEYKEGSNGEKYIALVEGRECNVIKGCKEKYFGNLVFKKMLRKAHFRVGIEELKYIQIIQIRVHKFEFRINWFSNASEVVKLVMKFANEYLDANFEYEIVYVDNTYIEEKKNEKPNLFICKC